MEIMEIWWIKMWSTYEIIDVVIISTIILFSLINSIYFQYVLLKNEEIKSIKWKKYSLFSLNIFSYGLVIFLICFIFLTSFTPFFMWLSYNVIKIIVLLLILFLVCSQWIIYFYKIKRTNEKKD
ncbi:hypothetical protein SPM_002275 [Spiroplasma melliferum KC3]|uniref:Uncharacterized protein n=3 Tax=Spiroplasma melliferum TaxID=2134 RepID=A0AAI9T4B7_SPIME|nr:hypothetical protein SPM_002275 [Spiroplasma melliferum KC3]